MALLHGPFADPRFRRLLAGQSLSSFGDTALYLALGIPALFAPAAGHLADRVRRRPLLIWSNALTAARWPSWTRPRSPWRSPRWPLSA